MTKPATLETQKAAARSSYISARNAWADTRTAENINGDPALWAALCDARRVCRLFGVRI